MGNSVEVTDTTFENDVLNSETPVLVDFWAEWCGPCKMIAPILEELGGELEGQVVIGKLDVDTNPNTAMSYGVMSIPTLILFKGGEPVERIVGYKPKPQLASQLAPHLG